MISLNLLPLSSIAFMSSFFGIRHAYSSFSLVSTLQHHSGPLSCLQPVPADQSTHQGFTLSSHRLLRSFAESIVDLIGPFLDIDFIDPEIFS